MRLSFKNSLLVYFNPIPNNYSGKEKQALV